MNKPKFIIAYEKEAERLTKLRGHLVLPEKTII